MLSQVEVLSDQGAILILPIGDSENGYFVEDIDGLDPVSAQISSSAFGQLDGEEEQGARREKRNIILTVGLEPDYMTNTVSSLRRGLYQWFMPLSRVTLRFVSDDMEVVTIQGIIEDMDAAQFTNDPKAIITIVAHKPDFLSLDETQVAGVTTGSAVDTNLEYPGSVPAGFVFRLAVNRSISGFVINQTLPDNSLRSLEFQAPMVAGDILELSTVARQKYATRTRGGTVSSLIAGVSPRADWLQLSPGVNKLRVAVAGAAIPYTIRYTSRYGGL